MGKDARAGAVALALVLIGSLRIISTYLVLSHTIDEPAHLGAGMEWLEAHRYTFEDQHPPVARVAGALGLELGGIHWSPAPDLWDEGFQLLGRGEQYDRARFYGRLAMLPFFWLGSLVVYLWTLREGGRLAALFATLLFTSLPPILAHAGLVTTDMALASTTALAVFVSLSWSERAGWKWNVIFGIALGLAILSKFSSLVFLPSAWLVIWIVNLSSRRISGKRLALPALASASIAFLVIWAGYRFTFHTVPFLHIPLPAPAFFSGIKSVWDHNLKGHESYLLGRISMTGFWYYYPVVLSLKTPLALLALLVVAIAQALRKDAWNLRTPLGMAAGILLCSTLTHINIGVRHILPVYVGVSVACGIICSRLWRFSHSWHAGKLAVVALLAWFIASGALQHPEYISYTNEIAGSHPEDYFVDSDLDWMQDMEILAQRLKRDHVEQIWSNCDPGYGLAGNLPPILPIPDGPSPPRGWTAVSVTEWKLLPRQSWIGKVTPTARIGRSLLLYYVATPVSAKRTHEGTAFRIDRGSH